MTKQQIQQAIDQHLKVEGGEGDGYDTGYIHAIIDDETVSVGWDSGVRTPCAIADLSLA